MRVEDSGIPSLRNRYPRLILDQSSETNPPNKQTKFRKILCMHAHYNRVLPEMSESNYHNVDAKSVMILLVECSVVWLRVTIWFHSKRKIQTIALLVCGLVSSPLCLCSFISCSWHVMPWIKLNVKRNPFCASPCTLGTIRSSPNTVQCRISVVGAGMGKWEYILRSCVCVFHQYYGVVPSCAIKSPWPN